MGQKARVDKEYTDRWMGYLNRLSKMGYVEFTIGELINNLAGLPPMMSVFVLDEDTDEKRYVNNVEVTTSEVPVFILHISQYPKSKRDELTYDEKVAHKKELAEGMENT